MGIYAKISIKRKTGETARKYIALLNSGCSLRPLSLEVRILKIPYIVVPPQVASEFGRAIDKLLKRGEYYVDEEYTYRVCLCDPEDKPVVCVDDCFLFVEEGLDRILIPLEFLMITGIKLDPANMCWEYKGRSIKCVFESKDIRELDRKLLRFTPYYELV